VLSRPIAWSVVIVAMLTMTVSYIDRSTLAVLAPTVTKALDISDTGYAVLGSAFSFAYLFGTPIAGWWIDRTGARRGLVRSVLAWSGVAALQALVPGFFSLFVLRIALGLAEGPGFPGAAQTVHRVLPPGSRPRGFGILFTGSSIGTMIAAPLASALYGVAGWRLAMVGTALVGLAWVPLWIVVTRGPVRAQLDASTDAVAAPRPPFRELVRQPVMLRALWPIFAIAPVNGLALMWGAKYLARTFAMPQERIGHYLWLPPLCLDIGAIAFGDLASRVPREPGAPPRLLFGLATLLGVSVALLPLAATPWLGMEILGLGCMGGGAIYALTTADLLARVPPHIVSFAGGTIAGAQSLALIIVGPLIGLAIDHGLGYGTVALAHGLWALPGTIIWIAWRPNRYLEHNV